MLNEHEVKAHNLKKWLQEQNRLVDKLENAGLEATRRIDNGTKKRVLPTCDPTKRAPRKIYMGGKSVGVKSHNARSAMPRSNEIREYLRGERS